MEFLVNIRIVWPETMSQKDIDKISIHEREKAKELISKGYMKRMWRIPGRRENWGLWQAKDATELHSILCTLPVFPFMDINGHPLAIHPVDPLKPEEIEVW